MSKVCTNCGKTLDDNVNFCPYCKSTSFKNKYEIVEADNSPAHRLLYWNYNGKYAISKTKFTAISVFLIFSVVAGLSGAPIAILLFAFAFAGITYVLGFAIHQMISHPSQSKLDHNDYGLLTDLKHFLLYWQNREGQYVFSKTKIISHLVFLMFFALAMCSPVSNLFVSVLVGLIIEVPVFFVGYGIHKITNSNPEAPQNYIEPKKHTSKVKFPKRTKPKSIKKGIVPEFMGYVTQLDELNSKFKSKEKATRNLIEKRFEPPQLTYTRFIGGVDKSAELFKKHSDAAYNMINIADEYSTRIAGEIESKIEILKAINEKMDNLANELVLSGDISKKEDVDNVMGEMDNLIDSVKDYDN